jgi:hypothetical protein
MENGVIIRLITKMVGCNSPFEGGRGM